MALIPKNTYPGQTSAADPNYPQGKAQNITTPGDGTGTPLEEQWVNDLWGFLQDLLDRANITPDGNPDEVGASQYSDALHVVGEQLKSVGSLLLGSAANARLPRIVTPYSASTDRWTLISESAPDAAGIVFRTYRVTRAGPSYQEWSTINASFNGSNWVRDVNGVTSSCVLRYNGAVSFLWRDGGESDTWTTGSWVTGQSFLPSGNAVIDGDFGYLGAAPQRVTEVPLVTGFGGVGWTLINGGWYKNQASGSRSAMALPVMLPHGATLTKVEVLIDHKAETAGNEAVARVYKNDPNYATPGQTQSELAAVTASSSEVFEVLSMTLSETIDNAKRYYVSILPGLNSGIQGDRVHGVRLTWGDPGPRNF